MFDDASFMRKDYYFCMLSILETGQLRNRDMVVEKPFTQRWCSRWYDDACKWLRLKHQIYDTELKNLMERFVQQIKKIEHRML